MTIENRNSANAGNSFDRDNQAGTPWTIQGSTHPSIHLFEKSVHYKNIQASTLPHEHENPGSPLSSQNPRQGHGDNTAACPAAPVTRQHSGMGKLPV
jgi:hypothetical protein